MKGIEQDMVSETDIDIPKHAKMEEEEHTRLAEESEKMEDEVGRIGT